MDAVGRGAGIGLFSGWIGCRAGFFFFFEARGSERWSPSGVIAGAVERFFTWKNYSCGC